MKTLFTHVFALMSLFCLTLFTVNEASASNTPKSRNVRIRQVTTSTGETDYRISLIVVGDLDNEVINVSANLQVINSTDPSPNNSTITLKLNRTLSTDDEKYFYSNGLDFKKSAVGFEYSVKTTLLDKNGTQVGKTSTDVVKVTDKAEKCAYDFEVVSTALSSPSGTIIVNGDLVIAKESATELYLVVGVTNHTTYSDSSTCQAGFAGVDCSGECSYVTTLTFNEKTKLFEGSLKIEPKNKCSITISDVIISGVNACDDSKSYLVNFNRCTGFGGGYTYFDVKKYNPEKEEDNEPSSDSCDTKYKLGSVLTTTSNISGLYTMQFQFGFNNNNDIPEKVRMVVQIKDCNGNTKNIEIDLNYNSKTGEYIGGQAIKQDSKCEWEIVDAEIGAYNKCDELSAWTLSINQYKSNGSGTRNVATANNGKPGLL